MLYLVVSILLMSTLAAVLRWAVGRGVDPHGLNAAYRVTGGLVTLALTLPALVGPRLGEFWHAAGLAGCIAAVFYWLAGLASIKSVELGHLGVSWAVIRCSMLIPALASLLYWREVPLWPPSLVLGCRALGLGVVVTALFLLGGRQGQALAGPIPAATPVPVLPGRADRRGTPGVRAAWLSWLALAFVAQGAWEICLRTTRSYPDSQTRSFFLMVTFSLAMLLAGASSAVARVRIRRQEILYGILAGCCALLASGVRVWALRDVDGMVVFPATTAGVLLLVQGAGFLFWRERLSRRGLAGLALAIVGIALLTVRL